MNYPTIILHKGKEVSLQRLHPWVFSGAIKAKEADLKEGTVVEVQSYKNEFLGMGFYAGGSIAVRIISFEKTEINKDFWERTLYKAYRYRIDTGILNDSTNVCRLFFGEGDGVPGLILDYYDGHVVLQVHTYGVYKLRHLISEALQKVLGVALKSIYDKSAETLSGQYEEKPVNGFLYGSQEEIVVKENDHLFKIDFIKGQKTGFFIDQRDNRALLASYSKGKNILNAFSYTGGFSVYALKAGALNVDSVDASTPAIDLCNQNIVLNGLEKHNGFTSDVFDFLKDKKDVYDVMVLDPPAFAKSRDSKHNAVIAYKRLNAMAIKLIRKGGIIFTFSCSGVVDKYLFYNTITAAALEVKRDVKILHYLTQARDHPTIPFFQEGEYLKGMVLWVGE
jgi:23S rRNA (cytosine1962-C5)-methyltransferase